MRVGRLGPRIVRPLALHVSRRNPTCRRRRAAGTAVLPPLVEAMSPETNHDPHLLQVGQLPQVRSPMSDDTTAVTAIPRALESYPSGADQTLAADLAMRVQIAPFNAIATGVFVLAILHTFAAARFARLAHRVQHHHDEKSQAHGRPVSPSLRAEALHFLGEVEVVFGLWAVVLVVATTAYAGWEAARHYVSETVNYTEPLFVVVIMALASTRPVIGFAESALRRVAAAGGATPVAWWAVILTIGPLLGSFITEPAAMTICALLLARQFFDLQPSTRLKYATLGVLFVNVSIPRWAAGMVDRAATEQAS
jgi:hypothetical protein